MSTNEYSTGVGKIFEWDIICRITLSLFGLTLLWRCCKIRKRKLFRILSQNFNFKCVIENLYGWEKYDGKGIVYE